jgi:putative ABC transport system permease protein
LLALSLSDLPMLEGAGIDAGSLACNFALAAAAGLLTGLGPALGASKAELNLRGSTDGMRGYRTRRLLSALQVACSVALLTGAGLLLRSFARLDAVAPGFEPGGALAVRLSLAQAAFPTSESIVTFCTQLRGQVEALPGVKAAGAVSILPMSGVLSRLDFAVVGRPPESPEDTPSANYRVIDPGYLRAMAIRLVEGRDFTDADARTTRRVAIVNQALARRFWPSGGGLGAHIDLMGDDRGRLEIVGVIADVKQVSLDGEAGPDIYIPYAQASPEMAAELRTNVFWVVRTAGDPMGTAGPFRRAVLSMNKDVAIASARPLETYLSATLAARRFNAVLLAAFAACALGLAIVAVYGTVSYAVARRTREIGLRMALGAQPGEVVRMAAGEGLRLTVYGVALGLAAAIAGSRFLAALLYETSAVDLATFAAVVCVLSVTSATASYIPARRSARIDPLEALRQE